MMINICGSRFPIGGISFFWMLVLPMCVFSPAVSVVLLFVVLFWLLINGKLINFQFFSARMIVGVLFCLYWVYFFAVSAFVSGNVDMAFSAMKGNLPLVIVGVICFFLDRKSIVVDIGMLGSLCVYAIWLIFFLAIYLTQIYDVNDSFLASFRANFWQGGRLELLARNPLMLASILLLVGFWGQLGFKYKSNFQKFMSVIALLMVLILIFFLIQARGATFLWLCLIMPFLWLLHKSSVSRYGVLKSLFIFLIFLLAVIFLSSFLYPEVIRRYDSMIAELLVREKGGDDSVLTRKIMWSYGFQAAIDGGIFGFGYENRFNVILPLLSDQILGHHGHLHNAMLNHWVAGGILGLVFWGVFTALPIILVKISNAKEPNSLYAAFVLTVVFFGVGLTTAVLGHYVHATLFGVSMATLAMLLDGNYVLTQRN